MTGSEREQVVHVAESAALGSEDTDSEDAPAVADLLLTGHPAVAEALSRAREQLTAWARSAGLDDEQVDDAALAVYEAMANIVDHAYEQPGGTFDLHACRCGDLVTVTVADRGRWKPPESGAPNWRGRGLLIMERATSALDVSRHAMGTTVRMSWLASTSDQP
ncbi:ATP-binding protein [Kutzneria sp. NPDC052558]|uniref:ATP-binding protein n=1 Tax=Kutzneria sp. NPDC052558 TaxID=3364121 RepID=UPI0037C57176